MHAWIRRALCAVGLTGGIVLLGIGLAEASSADGNGPQTAGESGILSGNQTAVDAQAPINLSGNQITVIGQRNHATSASGSSTSTSGSGSAGSGATTSGQDGIGSGNQTAVEVKAPVNASGNQVTVIGQDNHATSASGAAVPGAGPAGDATTSGAGGLLAGNQTLLGVTLPINITGNQVTVIGQDNTSTAVGGSSAAGGTGGDAGATGPTTSGDGGLISGNQTGITVLAPIAVTGNQVTAIGQDNTNTSTGGSTTGQPGSGGPGETGGPGSTTTGEDGIGSGNQTPVVVQVPVDAGGNQVTVGGQDNTNTSTSGSTSGGGGTTTPPGTGVVSPPSGSGTGGGGSVAAPSPGATVLPQTGASSVLGLLALLGALLVLLGASVVRRAAAEQA